MKPPVWEAWDRFWFDVTYPAFYLVFLRAAVALLILHNAATGELITVLGRHPEHYFPNLFHASFFDFLPPPPFEVFVWVGRGIAAAAFLALVGLWTRASFLAAAALFSYCLLLNRFTYENHYYYMAIAALACGLMPTGAHLSVDAWLKQKAGVMPPGRVFSWAARLLQVQMSLIYFGSALSKTTDGWASGKLLSSYFDYGYIRLYGQKEFHSELFAAMGTGSLILEYWLAFALWHRKTRFLAACIGIFFHASLYFGIKHVGTFSMMMLMVYPLFFLAESRKKTA